MYLLIVYDVGVERVNKVHNFLKTFLHWIQNSVFEGEVSKSQFNIIKQELGEIINKDLDSIIIYKIPKKYMKRNILGVERNPIELIL